MLALQTPPVARRLVGFATIAAASLYVAAHLGAGWIPHDEGQLGQAAERTLRGELPHRDFDDMYTGGLSLLGAAALKCWGVQSESLRIMLGLAFVPAIAAFYYLARRMLAPPAAAVATLLATVLSVPVYSAAMPSWYNLFCAVLGTAALARFVETGGRRWLLAAGLCGGASILIKITGLYFIAAALLFLAFREQLESELAEPAPADSGRWYSWLISAALCAFALLGVLFIPSGRPEMNVAHFTVPLAGLAGFLLWRERGRSRGPSRERWRLMASMAAPLAAGVAAPVAAWIAYYAAEGALGDLYTGLFVLPRRRVESGVYPLPGAAEFAATIPLPLVRAAGLAPVPRPRRGLELAVAATLVALLVGSAEPLGFNLAFNALRNSLPPLVLLVLWRLGHRHAQGLSSAQQQHLFLAIAAAALTSLVQYPHAYGIYFFYAAPLVVLAAAYLVAASPSAPRLAAAALAGFYLAFAALQLNGPNPHRNVRWSPGRPAAVPLELERCNLRVPAGDAVAYRELAKVVREHSPPDAYILAGPDCPEAYFLTRRRNPTPIMYEFFRPDWVDAERWLATADQWDVKVLVVNERPCFSPRYSSELISAIAARFPHERVISSPGAPGGTAIARFRVFWRD
jgi:hypothetical protein